MGFEVIANIFPNADKVDTVRSGLESLAKAVHANEKGCSRYQVYEQTNAEGGNPPQFVVVEEYDDKAAFGHHLSTQEFRDLGAAVQKENLLAQPLDVKFCNKVGGFLSR
ncbi:hypothetical protein LTR66_017219 [Elasticomyces elasticus]|nr:hypothetical protein LTR66_017219 [Elasticomyces elasticus]